MPSIWQSYTFTATVPGGEPPPVPDPDDPIPPPQPGTIQPEVRWISCDLVTGRIVADLPDLTPSGPIGRALGDKVSAGFEMPVPLSGPGVVPRVLTATEPGRSMLVAVVNDRPVWGGIVLVRKGGEGATLDLGTVTLEGYLGRRKVGDHVFADTDLSRIMSTLARDAEANGEVGQGIGLLHDVTDCGTTGDREYVATDRAWVLDRVQELSRVLGGPEWTIDLEWTDTDQTTVAKILRIAPRIGSGTGATFETKSAADVSYTLQEDFGEGAGANWVETYSSGQGDDQPSSDPAIDLDALANGWPIFERHWQPSTSITSRSVLNNHAAAELARRRDGNRVWTLSAAWQEYPRLGLDWGLGDTVNWQVESARHPDGASGSGRVIGWKLDLSSYRVEPVVVETGEEGE